MMKLKLSFVFVCIAYLSVAQEKVATIKEVFTKAQQFYSNNTAYELDLEYTIYKSSTSNEKLEFYKSKIIRNKNDYYYRVHNTEFIQIGAQSLKINHDEKALSVTKREAVQNPIAAIDNVIALLPQFKDYTITNKGNTIICELIAPKITQLPYSKVQLYFNKDYSVKQQVLYLSTALPFEEGGKQVLISPRIQVDFFNIKSYTLDKRLKLGTYIKKVNNTIYSSKNLLNYQIINN